MARAAYSLNILLDQLNKLAPDRNKASDGGIGDTAHQSRVSDHNPDARGIYHARDFTHDPAGGLNCVWLAGTLVHYRDPRIKYIIWDHKIWSPSVGWQSYNGDPHVRHLHLSVNSGNGDDRRQWQLSTGDGDMANEGPEIKRMMWEGGNVPGTVAPDTLIANVRELENMVWKGGYVAGKVDATSLFGRVNELSAKLDKVIAALEKLQ